MTYAYGILAFYGMLMVFSWLQLRRLTYEACEVVSDIILREVRLRKIRGDAEDYENLLNIASVFVRAQRDETLRQIAPRQMWMCFMVVTSMFMDIETFETTYKHTFSTASILDTLQYLETSDQPGLVEFSDVLRASLIALENYYVEG